MINPNDLRQLADFLDEHPVLADRLNVTVSSYTWSKEPWQEMLDELGTFEKSVTEWALAAERTFGDLIVRVAVDREATCTKVDTGAFRETTREVYPEGVTPVIETIREPVFEWVCPESWKARDEEATA